MPITLPKFSLALAAALAAGASFANAANLPIGSHAAGGRTDSPRVTPQIPSWIKKNTGVEYIGYSAFENNGNPSQSIEVTVNTSVQKATASEVWAGTVVKVVGDGFTSDYDWACTSTDSCTRGTGNAFQFWVCTNNPTGSIFGPDGETYSNYGTERYKDPWGREWSATVLAYQNSRTGVTLEVIYETSSGLILVNSQSFPTEYVVDYYYD